MNESFLKYLLIGEDIQQDIYRRAELLFHELWCNKDRLLFPETVKCWNISTNKNIKGRIGEKEYSLFFQFFKNERIGSSKSFSDLLLPIPLTCGGYSVFNDHKK